MINIRDLTGAEEGFTDYKDLTRTRKVNGEKTISLTVLPTKANQHSFHMVEEESLITFDNEEYVIKKIAERGIGNTYIKRADAIHKFFVDMINKQQPNIHNGSMTFAAFLSFVFTGTGYTFSIIDSFNAQPFENLGNDNRLALLQKGLERYKAEMEIIGKDVRFKKKIGNDTDFQFRYALNIKTIERNVDTTNLATVIKGKGAEGISASYRSPNADIFGEIDAPPVEDERFTTQQTLVDEMKARLQDTPEFSITIDFADLRAAGYPYTVPNEGDRVFVIYEPMNDLLIETRIMEVDETINQNGVPIKTNVTLANYKKTFAGTLLGNVQKRLKEILNDDGIIKYSVLDEAVRLATEALQSAQTELVFENGIIARDKNDPNKVVLFNSGGVGVSKDGGQTFRTAMTGDGVVAERIVGGAIIGVNLMSVDGDGLFHVSGADAELLNASGRLLFSPEGIYFYNLANDLRYRLDPTLVTSAALGTSNTNVYLAAMSNGEARVVDFNDVPGDGLVDSYRYLPLRASGMYGNFWNVNAAVDALHLYARPLSGGELRVTLNGQTENYQNFRANQLFANGITVNALHGSQNHFYLRTLNDGELRVTSNSSDDIYKTIRADGVYCNFIDKSALSGGVHLYVRPAGDPGELRVTVRGTTDVYQPVRAKNFITDTSLRENKKDVEVYSENVLDGFRNSQVYLYRRNTDSPTAFKQLGLMIDETPRELHGPAGDSIDLYAGLSYVYKGVKDHVHETDQMKDEINWLKMENQALKQRLDHLESLITGKES